MAKAKVVSTNISTERGTVKSPVPEGFRVIRGVGVEGDAHSGGSEIRQISLLATESIDKMNAKGFSLKPGEFAENITTQGLDLLSLDIGSRIRIGQSVVLEITQHGKKCHKGCEILKKVGDCIMPREGIFGKVVDEGNIKVEDEIVLI